MCVTHPTRTVRKGEQVRDPRNARGPAFDLARGGVRYADGRHLQNDRRRKCGGRRGGPQGMGFGIGIASGVDGWKVAQRAEALGFTDAWFYDTQMLRADIFVSM